MTSNGKEDSLHAALDALPRAIEPPRDLWPGIDARITAGRRRSVHARWGIAAALLAALAVAMGITLRGHGPAEPFAAREPVAQTPEPVSQSADPVAQSAEPPYFAARAQYAEAAVRENTRLMPEAQTVLLDNLHIIEASMLAIQQGLDKDPGNLQLRRLLFRLYEDEAAVLNAAQRVQMQAIARTVL